MGEIVFKNDPPYEQLVAQSAEAHPTPDGVELVVIVAVEGLSTETVPIRILLQPEVALALGAQMEPTARAARRWMDNRR